MASPEQNKTLHNINTGLTLVEGGAILASTGSVGLAGAIMLIDYLLINPEVEKGISTFGRKIGDIWHGKPRAKAA